ncbi:hypothetical protein F53441_13979 [Fusarium austroafricanum]|uniref:Uncharacterized protein n=1 Tax=Fusarium austroafricanum TaxID=2364996 RepID=A0A8H4JMD5_9HYPO|nr:hypothetical protein F53441_13979 [Fusarium austroafricanum]
MYPSKPTLDGQNYTIKFAYRDGSAVWNSTFSNVFALDFVAVVAGKPEVHWDDKSDKDFDSRYIVPNREDNIWFSFGAGAGSALMKQVFTVTKGRRRHTFIDYTFKTTMLTTAGVPFDRREVTDLVGRIWSPNATERSAPLVGRIINSMMNAQSRGMSYHFGGNTVDNGNKSVMQSNWGYYTVVNNEETLYSLISITTTNITLIRSETVSKEPEPIELCERSNSQNEAYGGKVTRIDCAGNKESADPRFFGQVDTAAVVVAHGLGYGRSNISSKSLNNNALTWCWKTSETIDPLLIARAYTVSVDPSLVQITVDKLIVAISRLQLALSCLALLMAIALWLTLMIFADAHWTSSPLANLLHTTLGHFNLAFQIGKREEQSQESSNIDISKVIAREGQRSKVQPTNQFYFLLNAKLYWAQHILRDSEQVQAIYRYLCRALGRNLLVVNAMDDSGRTPLPWAAEGGDMAVVRLLVEKGADIESRDKSNRTPLLRAEQGGQEAVVRLLESYDAQST